MNSPRSVPSDGEKPLFGDQYPRILVSPPAPTSAGAEVVELAKHFGLILDPWQCLVLEEGLKERSDGKWAAFEVGLVVSRQNGKGAILEALELAGLFLFGERVIQHSAHQFKTSKEAMRRLEFLLAQSGERYKPNHTHGEESIELTGGPNKGARVMFQTRTKSGGLGLSGDRVIFDEAMIISSEALQVLMPTLSAMPNPQIWYTGSAVDKRIHANCEVFSGLRQRALSGEAQRLTFLEWSCLPGADPESARERARANPGMGYRISPQYIEDEYRSFRGIGDVRAFGVQRLGIGDWAAVGDAASVIDSSRWATLHDDSPKLVGRPVVALCRSPDSGPWSIVAAQRTDAGRIHVEVGYVGTDPADVVMGRVVDVVTAWDPAALVVERHVEALPEFENLGIEVSVPTRTDEAHACGGLLDDVLASEPVLSHANQPDLNSAVARAMKQPVSGGGFIWASNDGHAFVQLMGATLARWGLLKFGGESVGPTIHEWPSDEEIQSWLEEDDDLFEEAPVATDEGQI